MIRLYIWICAAVLIGWAAPALAVSDGLGDDRAATGYFSARGNTQGFDDPDANIAAAAKANAVVPAAGDEKPDGKRDIAAPPPVNAVPDTGRPKDTDAKADKELEQTYGPGSDRKVIDHGKGMTQTQDTYGDGKVAVFQRETNHGQVMNTDSAAGVQVKVLQFK